MCCGGDDDIGQLDTSYQIPTLLSIFLSFFSPSTYTCIYVVDLSTFQPRITAAADPADRSLIHQYVAKILHKYNQKQP